MESSSQPYIIGIAGGTASGKTTMANTILQKVGPGRVAYVSYDYYYKDLSHLPAQERFKTNFDHPDSFDTQLLIQHLNELRAGHPVEIPQYDFQTCTRLAQTQHVEPRDVIIVEGILALADSSLRSMYDLKIYVDLDADERLLRRLKRDVIERGRTVESVVQQYQGTVRPMHDQFVAPCKQYADIVVPGEVTNSQALEAVAGQVLGRIEVARLVSAFDAFQKVGSDILSLSESHKTTMQTIAEMAARELRADNATLHQYDASREDFLDPAEFSATWPLGGQLDKPRRDGITAYVVKKNNLVEIADVDEESQQELVQTTHLAETATKAFLGIPLNVGGETLGVLFFNYLRPRKFGDEEKTLASILGMYAATAIHRTRLYGQIKRRADNLKELSEVGTLLLSADYTTVKETVVRTAARELRADNATLHQYDASREDFLDPAEFSATWPLGGQLDKPRRDGITAYVVKKNDLVEIADVDEESQRELVQTTHLAETATKAFLGIPLKAGGETLGVLFFNYLRPRKFGDEEKNLAKALSFYVSAAVLNSRLLEKHLTEQRAKLQAQEALEMVKADFPHFIKGQIGLVRLDAKDLLDDMALTLSREQREMLEAIYKNAEAAIDRLEISISSKNPPAPRWVTVSELMGETMQLMQPSGLAAGITLRSEIPPDLPKVFVDRLRVSLVFNELIMNAQKAIRGAERAQGLIEVSARLSGDGRNVEVVFVNDGPPIPQSKWQDIFNGLRLGPEGTADELKGTGLWRARILLEAQGGNIRILGSDQAKTTFVVRLPTFQPTF